MTPSQADYSDILLKAASLRLHWLLFDWDVSRPVGEWHAGMIGTRDYAAPESMRHYLVPARQRVEWLPSVKLDSFSLAATFVRCLTGSSDPVESVVPNSGVLTAGQQLWLEALRASDPGTINPCASQ